MLNCLFWLHTRTWTIMWWAGRTGTWPWTTSVDRTGLKTTSTAPSSWMHSATSSTSSRLSTAWPTSGSGAGPFVHIDADSTWSTMHTAQLCSPQQVPVGGLPESWRVLQSENRPELLHLHQTGWLGCSHRTEQVQQLCFHVLVRHFQVLVFFFCRSSSAVKFEVWDPSVGYIPASAPAHSLLTLAWKRHWLLTPA